MKSYSTTHNLLSQFKITENLYQLRESWLLQFQWGECTEPLQYGNIYPCTAAWPLWYPAALAYGQLYYLLATSPSVGEHIILMYIVIFQNNSSLV